MSTKAFLRMLWVMLCTLFLRESPFMASSIDGFGQVSNGLDRAEIGVSPPICSTEIRPEVPARTHKPSLRHVIKDSFTDILAHPQHGLRRVKRVIKEKNATEDETQQSISHVPILAPEPPLGFGNERWAEAPEEKSETPAVKDMIYSPISTLKSVACNQGGDEFAQNVARSEVTHSAAVRLIRQDQVVLKAPRDELADEMETYAQHKHARQDAFVRWSIDRHTSRVAVLPTVTLTSRPPIHASLEMWKDYISKVYTRYFNAFTNFSADSLRA